MESLAFQAGAQGGLEDLHTHLTQSSAIECFTSHFTNGSGSTVSTNAWIWPKQGQISGLRAAMRLLCAGLVERV